MEHLHNLGVSTPDRIIGGRPLRGQVDPCRAWFHPTSRWPQQASGVPMAQILFIGQPLGMIVLPIMIFHQIQLMVCGVIANRWSKSKQE